MSAWYWERCDTDFMLDTIMHTMVSAELSTGGPPIVLGVLLLKSYERIVKREGRILPITTVRITL